MEVEIISVGTTIHIENNREETDTLTAYDARDDDGNIYHAYAYGSVIPEVNVGDRYVIVSGKHPYRFGGECYYLIPND